MVARVLVALSFAAIVAPAALAAPAAAAPPPNDNRVDAQALSLPQKVSGTTVEATIEDGEPTGTCAADTRGSVWYTITGVKGRVALTVVAKGDLDATISVFEQKRSQTAEMECSNTDDNGLALVSFIADPAKVYTVRVAQVSNSVAGDFTLQAQRSADDAEAPGRHLPAKGTADTVNWATNPSDAWSARMRAGVSYRVNLAADDDDHCVSASLVSANDKTVRRLSCDSGYTIFTPGAGQGGRYTVFVRAGKRRLGNQKYHLQIARAGFDDMGPGITWTGNSIRGHLDGKHIDVADLYNWRMTRTAIVELSVSGGYDVVLISSGGRPIVSGDSESPIEKRIVPGRYFVLVYSSDESAGSYTLKRVERTITSTSVGFNGSGNGVAGAGQSVTVTGTVSPAVAGKIEITIDRFDPVYGWQFMRQVSGSAGGGSFSTSFVTTGVGRWRATAEYKGTHAASPSHSGYATLTVN